MKKRIVILGVAGAAAAALTATLVATLSTGNATAATSKATIKLSPAPVGQSKTGTQNLTPGTATFTPAHKGWPVQIQKQSGSAWKTVVKGKQSASGTFAFNVPATSGSAKITYRAVSSAASGSSKVASAGATSAAYSLVWSDEFNGSKLDATKWAGRQEGVTYGLRQCATNAPSQRSVSGGSAVLKATKMGKATKACPNGTFLNSMIATDTTKSFTYGVFAARVKFQSMQGAHAGFWLQAPLPATAKANQPAKNGAEVDVAEYYGNGRKDGGLGASVNWLGAGRKTVTMPDKPAAGTKSNTVHPVAKDVLAAGQTFSSGYHVVSVTWTKTSYTYRVDGKVVWKTTQGVSRVPEFLVLSTLTSDWEIPTWNTINNKLGSSTAMSVDWVRVWQK